ncbi:hypothetical protein EI546_10870 [Aequorivita sp. H23M31]|uniref:O-antigen ligase domain-containing protein n=1 Tax=Aequorivita ciconiae TaxID=2494375 RepID=A0A410G4J3_9FLAO|nr:hypothetical protein [Aequorivita sp. H23M31]QAA82194.1 hypothetical protein EI546_10870 [Aequorivita sp. H23M31]
MKLFYQIVLVVLFLATAAITLSVLQAVCLMLLFFGVWIADKKGKLEIPHYVFAAFGIYAIFLIIGLLHNHPKASIDIKYPIFGFIFYLFLVNVRNLNMLRLLFIINAVVAVSYILIYLGIVPSLWHGSSIGMGGRVYGPPIIAIVLICFYYLYNKRGFDLPLAISFLLAMIYLFLTSNLMNLVTAGALLALIVIDFRKLFNPGFIIGFALLIAGAIAFFNSDLTPDAIKEKLPYVLKPWEYASLKTRILDLQTALRAEDFSTSEKLIGKGFGVSTTVYRENVIAQSFSMNYTFREIDNGFYYIYHRGGYILLFLFLAVHIYLIKIIPGTKAKLGFIVIALFTNLLSIHYFTYVFYMVVPYLILESHRLKRNLSLNPVVDEE